MIDKESYERVNSGLKKAASCARQMAKAQKSTAWTALATQLDEYVKRAQELYDAPAMTRAEALARIDDMVARKLVQENNTVQ